MLIKNDFSRESVLMYYLRENELDKAQALVEALLTDTNNAGALNRWQFNWLLYNIMNTVMKSIDPTDTESLSKIAKSDSGNYYMFPFIRGDEKLTVSYGPVVRKDILDKAGVSVPETIDEWHTALKVFRDNGMSAPLSYDLIDMERLSAAFFGAYGVKPNFYVENGSVRFGYLEPGAKDALANLNSWYEENLLNKSIAKVSELLDSNILNSQTGATVTYGSGGIGKYMRAAAANNDTEFNLVPAPFPVLNKGEVSKFGSKESRFNAMNNAFITTACNNIELAMRFWDYGYSEDGHMLLNFGIEGESYTMVDGYPTYTELITNNPDGLDFGKALGRYALTASGPFVQDVRYIEQAYSLPQQKQALTVWAATDADTYNLPRLTFTVEESQAINKAMNNINTLTDEMVLKFIMGIEPLENYDTFVSQLKSFGIESVLETYNAALARYEGR